MMMHIGRMMDIKDQLTVLRYLVHDIDMVDALQNNLPHNVNINNLRKWCTLMLEDSQNLRRFGT
ncbi:hypothetical protein PHMEG_00034742 [Phytophthora megakarya]|uniref:Uncharacterized protein n=1 Tax=Phytophthora megakarya TaxID=4795 RepID=A0A225USX2_9STRA|nr:hypothetical protein PHMEG_00034742 [Phytophthora megakarya]